MKMTEKADNEKINEIIEKLTQDWIDYSNDNPTMLLPMISYLEIVEQDMSEGWINQGYYTDNEIKLKSEKLIIDFIEKNVLKNLNK
jgi:hypothetical protein